MILNRKYDANSLLLTDRINSTDRMLYLDFTSDTRDMWIVQFCSTEVLTFENLKKVIPADILDQIRNRKIVLLLENFDNPDIENLVNCIYQEVVINGNIPVNQIKLLSCMYDTFYQIKPAAERFNLAEIEFEERETTAQNFWDNPEIAEKKLKQIRDKKVWTDGFKKVHAGLDDLKVIIDFYKEDGATEAEVDQQHQLVLVDLEELEFKNMLSGKEDNLSCVLTINSGAGGTERVSPACKNVVSVTISDKSGFEQILNGPKDIFFGYGGIVVPSNVFLNTSAATMRPIA